MTDDAEREAMSTRTKKPSSRAKEGQPGSKAIVSSAVRQVPRGSGAHAEQSRCGVCEVQGDG